MNKTQKIDVPLGETQPEELQSKQLKLAEREIAVMSNLDRIKEPIDAIIYLGDQKVKYRNITFETFLLGIQKDRKKMLLQFIDKVRNLKKK